MRARTRRQFKLIARITVFSAAIGAIYGVTSGGGQPIDALQGMVAGTLIAFVLGSAEIMFFDAPAGTPLRRLPLAAVLAFRAAFYLAGILAGLEIAETVVEYLGAPPRTEGSFTRGFVFSLVASFVANVVILVRRLIGPTLLALLGGRYRRAREEERAVLFLDLRGSTALTERLGNVRFLQFLDRVIFAATEQIMDAGGYIYRYVGDEIIVTWPVRNGTIDPRALACKLAIEDGIAAHASAWEREFGAVPAFRAGLHAGTVVVSELGDIRREIVLLGDVMNTTARIADLCRDKGQAYLVSDAVISKVTVPEGVSAASIGRVALRGKAEDLELFAVSKAARTPEKTAAAAFAGTGPI